MLTTHGQIKMAKQKKKNPQLSFCFVFFLTHIFLLYWMWRSHASHSPLLLFSHCLWSACQEELLFLLLLPVSRKWVITTLHVSNCNIPFKKPTETVCVWWCFKICIFLDPKTIVYYLLWFSFLKGILCFCVFSYF